jgi:hypothetical protein
VVSEDDCRNSRFEVLLEDDGSGDDEEDEVDAAGAVLLVTIIRFTWRGK